MRGKHGKQEESFWHVINKKLGTETIRKSVLLFVDFFRQPDLKQAVETFERTFVFDHHTSTPFQLSKFGEDTPLSAKINQFYNEDVCTAVLLRHLF